MRAVTVLVAAGVVFALAGMSQAGTLLGTDIPGINTSDGGAPGTFTCEQRDKVEKYCRQHGVKPDPGGSFLQVCINDFTYYPPVVTPRQGDVVAWVNVEKCADPNGGPVNVVEGLFAGVLGAGCDTHHEVVTDPDESALGQDTLNARLCSRFPSIPAKPGTPPIPDLAIDTGKCGEDDTTGNTTPVLEDLAASGGSSPVSTSDLPDTNVFCHKFQNPGGQHYTCFSNPAHTLVLHGGILVLPKGAPEIPELPDQPQL